MKIAIFLICIGLAIGVYGQTATPKPAWNVTLKVVDESNQPVEFAQATVFYLYTNSISGLTDTDGIFKATDEDFSENLAFNVQKAGFYTFRATCHLRRNGKEWTTTQPAVLKHVINPTPMYAKRVNTHVPALDKQVGYDLMVGDWVAPYGKGVQADILFKAQFDKSITNESDFRLTVAFPNPGDGIQPFGVPKYYLNSPGSVLRSAEFAPEEGYLTEWIQTDNRKAGRPGVTNRDLNGNYYFRVRTVLNDQGKVVSTHYGKIYGDFMNFRYFLNPTPNSRGMEFDAGQNLLKGLNEFEEVSEP